MQVSLESHIGCWARRFAAGAVAAVLSTGGVTVAAPSTPPDGTLADVDLPPLLEAWEMRRAREGDAYDARTALRDAAGGPRFVNRLITETSPYLRQHAHNPVDWRPWGADALAEAQSLDKPIFLSVGYATCHWCHVMERESFDNLEIAAQMNRDFIAVKVDREELPAVDETYMLATQILRGSGGWPNSVWMTPEGAPFHAVTYLPPDMFQRTLDAVAESWSDRRAEAQAAADQLAGAMKRFSEHRDAAAAVDRTVFDRAASEIAQRFNPRFGGFSPDVQFPWEVYSAFLLDRWRRVGDPIALGMATLTLDAIIAGGLHDHVGGGFHRYAVDPGWTLPHFEKMLYNQGQIGANLVAAYEATNAPRYRRAAERAFDYVIRDMTAPDGAFFAAEDADSVGWDDVKREGAFYAWSQSDLRSALGAGPGQGPSSAATADAFVTAFGVDRPAQIPAGKVLVVDRRALEELPRFDPALAQLRNARAARSRPLRDEKIIAGWNGLMIRALAEGGASFDRGDYLVAAARAGDAVWNRLWTGARLDRLDADGAQPEDRQPGALSDYAWLGLGYLALLDATGDVRWRDRALALAAEIEPRFSDASGRLKLSEIDSPLGPVFEHDDGSTASGESAALDLFGRLARREDTLDNQARAERLLAALSGGMAARPSDRTTGLQAAWDLAEGESGARRPLSAGKVFAAARRDADGVVLRLRIAEGWHLNARNPLEEFLVPTRLDGDAMATAVYPAAKQVSLGFNPKPLAVYDGEVEIIARLTPAAAEESVTITATLQACSDEICLAPETAAFRLPPPR